MRSLAIFLAALFLSWDAAAADYRAPEVIPLGGAMPELPATGWINGPAHSLAEARGKIALFYVFRPDCPNCEDFLTHLRRLHARYANQFVAFGLSEQPERALGQYAAHAGGSLTGVLHDPGKIYALRFIGNYDQLPACAIVDGEGRLVWSESGKEKGALIRELDRRLALLAGRAPTAARVPFRRAVVVATVSDGVMRRPLSAAVPDAEAVAAVCRAAGCETVLLDDRPETAAASRPTPDRVREALRSAAAAAGKDGVFFFYSGCGIQQGEGANDSFSLFLTGNASSNAITLQEVAGCLGSVPSLALLDLGHRDGGAAPYRRLTDALEKTYPALRVIFSGSGPTEQSQAAPAPEAPGRTRFTRALLEGLRGAADADGDQKISAAEIARHLHLRLSDWNRTLELRQSPYAFGLDLEPEPAFFSIAPAQTPAATAPTGTPAPAAPVPAAPAAPAAPTPAAPTPAAPTPAAPTTEAR